MKSRDRKHHFDPHGWVRPLDEVERMLELREQVWAFNPNVPQSLEETQDAYRVRKEYAQVCKVLGVNEALSNREQQVIVDIARAVEGGASVTPSGRPSTWRDDQFWLHTPTPWDPDFYVAKEVEGLFSGDTMLAGLPGKDLRIAAIAVLLVLDEDRSGFESLALAAGVDPDLVGRSGMSESQSWLWWEACSPVRSWVLTRNFLRETSATDDVEEWAHLSRTDLDQAVMDLGEFVLEAAESRTRWDFWIPAAMWLLETESVMVGELQRRLKPIGFPQTPKSKERLSAVLRGVRDWPGRRVKVVLASGNEKRLVPASDWQKKAEMVLGVSLSPPEPVEAADNPF